MMNVNCPCNHFYYWDCVCVNVFGLITQKSEWWEMGSCEWEKRRRNRTLRLLSRTCENNAGNVHCTGIILLLKGKRGRSCIYFPCVFMHLIFYYVPFWSKTVVLPTQKKKKNTTYVPKKINFQEVQHIIL